MTTYHLFGGANGQRFSVNPRPVKARPGKGWAILAFCDDATIYGGHYTKIVGWAGDAANGHIAFRLKRDAAEAIAIGLSAGVFTKREA